jgi:hypothetical protein
MRRLVVVAAATIVLPASAARADDIPVQTRAADGASTSAVPVIGSTCLINRSALASGRLVRAGRDSVTVAVEDGSGTARAFIGARLLLPVAPNATFRGTSGLGALHPGDRVRVLIVPCPDTTGLVVTLVAGRLDLAPPAKKPRKR